MYSLYNLLMFFKQQQIRNYDVIEKIVSIIDSDKYTDEQMRELIFELLRESGMVEEGFELEEDEEEVKPLGDGIWAQVQEFELRIQDRIYRIIYYLN